MKTLTVKCQFGNHQHTIQVEDEEKGIIYVDCPIKRKRFPVVIKPVVGGAHHKPAKKDK